MSHRRALLPLLLVPALFLAGGLIAEESGWLSDLQIVIQRTPWQFPSSQVIARSGIASGQPVLSVYTHRDHLWEPERGLLTNPSQTGREWERPATVSYFERGELLFATGVGLRLHGGDSRFGSPVQSVRLHFRRDYGSDQFRPGVLFGGRGDPLTRLVVHNDLRQDGRGDWWHFVNPLAYDIADRVGAIVPATHPAQYFLNGERQGVYVLTEHVRRPFLVARFGHDNFARADLATQRRLMREVERMPAVKMADVTPWLDLENLTRWFVSVIFCATSDPFQGVMFRDETRGAEGRWFWVNWDMDHSFMDLYLRAPQPWQQDTFRTTLNRPAVESRVITRLIADDPAYRDYLAAVFLDALNHRITPSFLLERYRHYQRIAETYGVRDLGYLDTLLRFLEFRPAHVRELLAQYLDLGPIYRYRVEGPDGVTFMINSHAESSGFSGWYAEGLEVTVALAEPRDDFSHWEVNGHPVRQARLSHPIGSETVIIAKFLDTRRSPARQRQ
jgi:hypothetical protein